MADYGGTAAMVVARLGNVDVTAISKPSTSDIDSWIESAEAQINAYLKAGGSIVPITDADGVEQLRELTLEFAEGRTRRALAPPGSSTDDADKLLDGFKEILKDMRENPAAWGAQTSGGSADEDTTRLRNHVVNDVDGRTRADFAPTFAKADGGDQF
jgi:hypothetical protein